MYNLHLHKPTDINLDALAAIFETLHPQASKRPWVWAHPGASNTFSVGTPFGFGLIRSSRKSRRRMIRRLLKDGLLPLPVRVNRVPFSTNGKGVLIRTKGNSSELVVLDSITRTAVKVFKRASSGEEQWIHESRTLEHAQRAGYKTAPQYKGSGCTRCGNYVYVASAFDPEFRNPPRTEYGKTVARDVLPAIARDLGTCTPVEALPIRDYIRRLSRLLQTNGWSRHLADLCVQWVERALGETGEDQNRTVHLVCIQNDLSRPNVLIGPMSDVRLIDWAFAVTRTPLYGLVQILGKRRLLQQLIGDRSQVHGSDWPEHELRILRELARGNTIAPEDLPFLPVASFCQMAQPNTIFDLASPAGFSASLVLAFVEHVAYTAASRAYEAGSASAKIAELLIQQ